VISCCRPAGRLLEIAEGKRIRTCSALQPPPAARARNPLKQASSRRTHLLARPDSSSRLEKHRCVRALMPSHCRGQGAFQRLHAFAGAHHPWARYLRWRPRRPVCHPSITAHMGGQGRAGLEQGPVTRRLLAGTALDQASVVRQGADSCGGIRGVSCRSRLRPVGRRHPPIHGLAFGRMVSELASPGLREQITQPGCLVTVSLQAPLTVPGDRGAGPRRRVTIAQASGQKRS